MNFLLLLFVKVTDRDVLAVRMEGVAFMREVASRIIKKAPCKYRLVRNLSCLDPRKMVASKGNWRNLYSCNYHIPVCKYSGISTKLTCRLYVYTRPGLHTTDVYSGQDILCTGLIVHIM